MVWPALIGAASGVATNIWNAHEAAKNRRFQERMSSSAHTREVADLKTAGINPMLSRMGSGASAPGGDRAEMEDVGSKAFSAAQLVLLKKQGNLLDAQAQREVATAQGLQQQNMEFTSGTSFRLDKLRDESRLASLSVQERQQLVPLALKRAKAEIAQVSSSAQSLKARAMLDELARTGAMNEQAFQEAIGEAGPWVQRLIMLIRSLR